MFGWPWGGLLHVREKFPLSTFSLGQPEGQNLQFLVRIGRPNGARIPNPPPRMVRLLDLESAWKCSRSDGLEMRIPKLTLKSKFGHLEPFSLGQPEGQNLQFLVRMARGPRPPPRMVRLLDLVSAWECSRSDGLEMRIPKVT